MSLGSQERDPLQSPLAQPRSALNWSVEWEKTKTRGKAKIAGFLRSQKLVNEYFDLFFHLVL